MMGRDIPGLRLRLYLLAYGGVALAIEVDDVRGGGTHLAELPSPRQADAVRRERDDGSVGGQPASATFSAFVSAARPNVS